jgi:hypothetical protein
MPKSGRRMFQGCLNEVKEEGRMFIVINCHGTGTVLESVDGVVRSSILSRVINSGYGR